jgi:hypothetical protein
MCPSSRARLLLMPRIILYLPVLALAAPGEKEKSPFLKPASSRSAITLNKK